MSLQIVFRGIEIANDGTYPCAKVSVFVPDESVPQDLASPSIEIRLPLGAASRVQSVDSIAAQTQQIVSQLVNEAALTDWLRQQTREQKLTQS